MRRAGALAAIVATCSATLANAQAANQAFECALPYRATMEAMAGLTVIEQRSDPGLTLLRQGPAQIVEFAPEDARVFGQSPSKLLLTMREPLPDVDEPIIKVTFEAVLPRETSVDEAIKSASTWHLGACSGGLCIRADEADPEGGGQLWYHRLRIEEPGRYEFLPDKIECIFEFTPDQLDALGE